MTKLVSIMTAICLGLGFTNIILWLGFQTYKIITFWSWTSGRVVARDKYYGDLFQRLEMKHEKLKKKTVEAIEHISCPTMRQTLLQELKTEGLI